MAEVIDIVAKEVIAKKEHVVIEFTDGSRSVFTEFKGYQITPTFFIVETEEERCVFPTTNVQMFISKFITE